MPFKGTGELRAPARATRSAAPVPYAPRRRSGTTERVSLTSADAQITKQSTSPSISDDGRYVVYASNAGNIVPGVGSGTIQVYVRDLATDTTAPAMSAVRVWRFLSGVMTHLRSCRLAPSPS